MTVIGLRKLDYREPCAELRKYRGKDADGNEVFGRWCYKHSHWLNDAPAQRTVADELAERI